MKARLVAAVLLCGTAGIAYLSACNRDRDLPVRSESRDALPMMETRTDHADDVLSTDTLARDISSFAFDLYRELRPAEGNLLLSPYGISAVFAMARAGARGDTEAQLARALRYTLPQERLHPAFAGLAAALAGAQEGGRVQLRTANSVWPRQGYPLLESYLSLLKRDYGAAVTPLRFGDAAEAARTAINRWVEEQTDRRIRDLIGPGALDAETRLVLVSAIYFRGEWRHRFQPGLTHDAPFFITAGKSGRVPMMRQEGEFRYGELEGVQLLELPYVGNRLSLLIVLPRDRDGLQRVEQGLSVAGLARWRNALRPEEVEVFLPRFRTSSTIRLDQALAALGMTDAFDPNRADFSSIDGHAGELYLDAALHAAWIDVNETGTEAAAATAAVAPSAAPGQPLVFRADHPFLFAISETQTGTLLFLGRLADPGNTGG